LYAPAFADDAARQSARTNGAARRAWRRSERIARIVPEDAAAGQPSATRYPCAVCTLAVVLRARDDAPLVVAANRDEYLTRPTAPPQADDATIVSGVDGRAGGTWMGATRGGVIVAVTNHRTFRPADGTKRSRGPLVMEALRLGDADAIARMLEAVDGRDYNPFNLLFGDARSLRCAYGREEARAVEIEEVPDGVHVVPNDRLDAPAFSKVARTRATIEPALGASFDAFDAAVRGALADHTVPPLDDVPEPPTTSVLPREMLRVLEATCVHTPIWGTRSSTIAIARAGKLTSYRVAEGPSCTSRFRDVA
jgi:uncharacterized protein with NRDE domain